MKRTALTVLALLVASFPSFASVTNAARERKPSIAGRPCGLGTISFRAWIGGGETRFTCSEGSWYDGGLREYAANLSGRVDSHYVTLVVIHVQDNANWSRRGLLLKHVVRVRDTTARTLRGTIDFSSVYRTSPPAGAPPFGTYFVSVHRGRSVDGQLLAQGQFQVIED